eukprot:6213760-Pleurochrysis_carterae.AAC.1
MQVRLGQTACAGRLALAEAQQRRPCQWMRHRPAQYGCAFHHAGDKRQIAQCSVWVPPADLAHWCASILQ